MNSKKLSMTVMACSAAALLGACGGGGSGGIGTETEPGRETATISGSPTVSGTVTGFGSVIVDGVRIDDTGTIPAADDDSDRLVNVKLKIGQSVDIQHDGTLKAKQIRITPELKGRVSAVDTTAGTLTVLGMTITINADPALGPVTVFEAPYSFAAVKAGDGVEIHGISKTDATGKPVIQATRIEKESLGNVFKLRGNVSTLSAGATTFKVGEVTINYQNARILPTPAAIFNGADVTVTIPATATFNGAAVSATKVVVKNHREESKDKEAQFRGAVSNLIIGAQTFVIDGITIDAAQAKFERSGRFADLSNGAYVRVKGVFQTDGSVKATSIALRKIEIDEDGDTELHGSILNFVSASNFTVRGVTVDATGVLLRDCPAGTVLRNNLQVEVEGTLSVDGSVKATKIECDEQDADATVEREGVAGSVDVGLKTFVLTGSATAKIKWSDATLFVAPLTAESLSAMQVEVEGVMTGDVLTASKIELDD